MESKLQMQRREYAARLKTDGELPKVVKEPEPKPVSEKPSEREVRKDAE